MTAAVLFAGVSFAQNAVKDSTEAVVSVPKNNYEARIDSIAQALSDAQRRIVKLTKQNAENKKLTTSLKAAFEKTKTELADEKKANEPKPFDPGYIDPKAVKYVMTDPSSIKEFFTNLVEYRYYQKYDGGHPVILRQPLSNYQDNPVVGDIKSITVYAYRFADTSKWEKMTSCHAKIIIVSDKGSYLVRLYDAQADIAAVAAINSPNQEVKPSSIAAKFTEAEAKAAVEK